MIKIKKATQKDAKQLLNLHQTTLLEPQNLLQDPETWQHSLADEKENIKSNDLYLVTIDGNQIVGSLIFVRGEYRKNKHAGQFEIFIRQEFRGKGIGQKLIKELLKWAKQHKIKRIELEVWGNNLSAIKLYKKIGFTTEGRKKKAYKINSKYVDGIIMSKLT